MTTFGVSDGSAADDSDGKLPASERGPFRTAVFSKKRREVVRQSLTSNLGHSQFVT